MRRLQLTTKLGRIGDYLTYSTTNLSIDIVGNRFSSGKQKWHCRLSLSSSSFLTDNVSLSMKKYNVVVGFNVVTNERKIEMILYFAKKERER